MIQQTRSAEAGEGSRYPKRLSIGGPALAAALSLALACGPAPSSENAFGNEQAVRSFIAAWSDLDARKLVDYFTEDGTYHNMMLEPVTGRAKLLEFIEEFLSTWTETQWDVVHVIAMGDLVFAERVDRTRIGERSVDLPCVGVFEMQNGKIRVWRDYFDMATYTKAFEDTP